jgi:hypothetical protein
MIEGWLRATRFVALGVVTACASNEAPPSPPSAPLPEATPHERWARFDELASFPALNDPPFPTRGHLVKPSHAVVRASPEARAQYLALVTDTVLPDGATIALFHQSSDGSEQGLVYVMEKESTTWTFLVLEADGRIAAENGSGCALCHRGGVGDHLFGLPRSITSRTP